MAKLVVNITVNNADPSMDSDGLAATLRGIISNIIGIQPTININNNNSMNPIKTQMIMRDLKNRNIKGR